MTTELQLTLFNGWHAEYNQEPFPQTSPAKQKIFLAYLALNRQTMLRRDIAHKFWPDAKSPLNNLRVNLSNMNKNWPCACFEVSQKHIAIHPNLPVNIDVILFEDAIQQARKSTGATFRAAIREAAQWYTGDFLAGLELAVPDANEIVEWIVVQRARFQALMIDGLDRLLRELEETGDFESGVEFGRQLVALDPLREESHYRLMGMYARNGQRTEALQQYALCQQILQEQMGVPPQPETQMLADQIKNRTLPGLETLKALPPIPPTPQREKVPFQVSEPLQTFVGRDEELEKLPQMLLPGNGRQRRVAIVGMGGAGKSSLAREAAYELKDRFADGVLWADARFQSLENIAESWAAAYGYNFQSLPQVEERLEALRGVLASKEVLLILDDVAVAAKLRPLLPENASCSILITTRDQNTAKALGATLFPLQLMTQSDWFDLLSNVIGQERLEAEKEAAQALGEALQYLPLALSLAARRLAQRERLRIADHLAHFQEKASQLNLGAYEQAMEASLQVSWDSLDQHQRLVLAMMGIFEGRAFSVDAITAVTGNNESRYWFYDRLDDLVKLSLLEEAKKEGKDMFRQHMLLAAYARKKLQALGLGKRPYQRFVTYYLQFAQEHSQVYSRLSPEWPNLDAAIETAARFHMHTQLIGLVNTLRQTWLAQARYDQALQAMALAETAAAAEKDLLTYANITHDRSKIYLERTQYTAARDTLLQALPTIRQIPEKTCEARAHLLLGEIYHRLHETDEARKHLTLAQTLFQQCGDEKGRWRAQYLRIFIDDEQFGADEDRGRQLQTICQNQERIGDTVGLIDSLRLLVIQSMQLAKPEAFVLASAQKANHLAEAIQDQGQIAMTNLSLSSAYDYGRNSQLAKKHALKALEMLQKHGDRRGIAQVYYKLAIINNDLGLHSDALEIVQKAIQLCQEIPDYLGEGYLNIILGNTFLIMGNKEAALQAYQRAVELGKSISSEGLTAVAKKRLQGLHSEE